MDYGFLYGNMGVWFNINNNNNNNYIGQLPLPGLLNSKYNMLGMPPATAAAAYEPFIPPTDTHALVAPFEQANSNINNHYWPPAITHNASVAPVAQAVPPVDKTRSEPVKQQPASRMAGGPAPCPRQARSRAQVHAGVDDGCCLCDYRPTGDVRYRRGSLAKHMKTVHGPARLFPCTHPGCESVFKNRPDNLKQHMKMCHSKK